VFILRGGIKVKLTIAFFILLVPFQYAMADSHIPNAVTADPKHYTVEFENDVIRVVRIKYGPGEVSAMHSHDASCAIFLSDGNMRMELPDGSSSEPPLSAMGTVNCSDAEAHLPSNVGDTPVELILVEMKGRKTAT
jgi:quercetin dioxygenase-like cupin family protein